MPETWTLLRSDADVGSARAMEVAAVCATLVDPALTALRLESAVMARDDSLTVTYLLNDACVIDGQPARTSQVKDWLLADGKVAADAEPLWNALAVRDAEAGIKNTQAILHWMRTGQHYRMETTDDQQRTIYRSGSLDLVADVVTCETHSLPKAAALGRLGMGLYTITGTPSAPRFVLHASSASRLLDEAGVPVTYDAPHLIMGEIHDQLPLSHPFILAYRAAQTWLELDRILNREVKALVVTPDVLHKRSSYDPWGRHALIHPNAPGNVWDATERKWFR